MKKNVDFIGKNTLLVGIACTGKTYLTMEALKNISKLNNEKVLVMDYDREYFKFATENQFDIVNASLDDVYPRLSSNITFISSNTNNSLEYFYRLEKESHIELERVFLYSISNKVDLLFLGANEISIELLKNVKLYEKYLKQVKVVVQTHSLKPITDFSFLNVFENIVVFQGFDFDATLYLSNFLNVKADTLTNLKRGEYYLWENSLPHVWNQILTASNNNLSMIIQDFQEYNFSLVSENLTGNNYNVICGWNLMFGVNYYAELSNARLEKIKELKLSNKDNADIQKQITKLKEDYDGYKEKSIEFANKIANKIISIFNNHSSNDPFWINSATKLLSALILVVSFDSNYGENRSMKSVYKFSSEYNTLDDLIISLSDEHPAKSSFDFFNGISAITKNAILTMVKMSLVTVSDFEQITSEFSLNFNLDSVTNRKIAIFIPINDIKLFHLKLGSLYSQVASETLWNLKRLYSVEI